MIALGNGQVWRVARSGGPGRPEPTTAIVRRGEDGWGRGAGRRLRLAALPSATTASAVVPASVAGPAELDHYQMFGCPSSLTAGHRRLLIEPALSDVALDRGGHEVADGPANPEPVPDVG